MPQYTDCPRIEVGTTGLMVHMKFNMAAAKPEVVISFAVFGIEPQFQMLILCFMGWPTQLNDDRHETPMAYM